MWLVDWLAWWLVGLWIHALGTSEASRVCWADQRRAKVHKVSNDEQTSSDTTKKAPTFVTPSPLRCGTPIHFQRNAHNDGAAQTNGKESKPPISQVNHVEENLFHFSHFLLVELDIELETFTIPHMHISLYLSHCYFHICSHSPVSAFNLFVRSFSIGFLLSERAACNGFSFIALVSGLSQARPRSRATRHSLAKGCMQWEQSTDHVGRMQ